MSPLARDPRTATREQVAQPRRSRARGFTVNIPDSPASPRDSAHGKCGQGGQDGGQCDILLSAGASRNYSNDQPLAAVRSACRSRSSRTTRPPRRAARRQPRVPPCSSKAPRLRPGAIRRMSLCKQLAHNVRVVAGQRAQRGDLDVLVRYVRVGNGARAEQHLFGRARKVR